MAGRPRKIAKEFEDYTTPQAILVAAERICGEQGLSGLKLREIARRIGIEPASIYNHYKGLDGVLIAVVAEAVKEQAELFDLPETMQGEAAIHAYCLRSAEYLARRKGIARLMISDFADVHDTTDNAFDTQEAEIVQAIDKEVALLRKHLGLDQFDRRKLGQLTLARMSTTLMLLAQRWMNNWSTDPADIADIAEVAALSLIGVAEQMKRR